MNKTLLILLSLLSLLFVRCSSSSDKDSLALIVNPFIDTNYTGNTYPGAQLPFGMVQLSPDNRFPGRDRIAGFSHTYLSETGAGDLYDISFMPVTIPYIEAEKPLGIHSKFSHNDERAHAGYYQVWLTDYSINVELTATERCGIQKYTFPKSKSAIFLNLRKSMNGDFTTDSEIKLIDSVTIEGYRYSIGCDRDQKLYFRALFSKPFNSMSIDTMEVKSKGERMGTSYVARFDFDTKEGEKILLYTALSGTSVEGATKNLEAEIISHDFDYYVEQAEQKWNEKLSCFQIEDTNRNNVITFYTALYHSMLAPTYNDVDGAHLKSIGDFDTKRALEFTNTPDGLCGDEDYGQMSAWYIFSAMGFYPINPVGGEYQLGTPLFANLKLHLKNGKTFTVKANNHSTDNIYVKSVMINGEPYKLPYITLQHIMSGSVLEFEMTDKP